MFINPIIEDINAQIDKMDFDFSELVSWNFKTKKMFSPIAYFLRNRNFQLFILMFLVSAIAFPILGYCSVESTLSGIQSKLITSILPLVAILGLLFAALSFASGSQNARGHLVLAIIGAVVGFGAPSIIAFIRTLVQ